MTLTVRNLVALFILIIGFQSQARFACDELDRRNEAARAGTTFNEFPWASLAANKVILLGEEHSWSHPGDLALLTNNILNAAGSSKKACFFLEFPQSISMEEFKSSLDSNTSDPGQLRYLKYYKAILTFAEQMGLNVYLVDHPGHADSELSLNERDEAMGARIAELLHDGTCERSFMTVGKAHIAPDDTNRITLPQHLRARNISFATINVQYVNESHPEPILHSWNLLCPVRSGFYSEPVLFSHEAIKDLPNLPAVQYHHYDLRHVRLDSPLSKINYAPPHYAHYFNDHTSSSGRAVLQ